MTWPARSCTTTRLGSTTCESYRSLPLDVVVHPRPLHQLAQRRGHTLIVLGGPRADPARVGALLTELQGLAGGALEAVVGLATAAGDPRLGRMDEPVAAALGVDGVTVLAVRPDRYIGLRDDRGDASAVRAYLSALVM